jgi:hypothetical protein
MALLWIEGFDSYATGGTSVDALLTTEGYQFSGGCVIDSNTASGQGYCMKQAQRAGGLQMQLVADKTAIITGIRIKYDPIATNIGILYFYYNSSTQFGVGVNSAGQLTILQSTNNSVEQVTTVVGGSAYNTLFPNTWYYLEVKYIPHHSAGSIEVKINGSVVASYSGNTMSTDTGVLANATNRIVLCMATNIVPSVNVYYDDWYVLDNGPGLSNYLGDLVVVTTFPIGDAGPNAMSATGGTGTHASAVTGLEDDTRYLTATATGVLEMFGISNLPASVVGVTAAQVHARAKCDSAATTPLEVVVAKGTATISAAKTLTTSFTSYDLMLESTPDGTAWNPTNAQALVVGVESA